MMKGSSLNAAEEVPQPLERASQETYSLLVNCHLTPLHNSQEHLQQNEQRSVLAFHTAVPNELNRLKMLLELPVLLEKGLKGN